MKSKFVIIGLFLLFVLTGLFSDELRSVPVGNGGYTLYPMGEQQYAWMDAEKTIPRMRTRLEELQWYPAGEGKVYITDEMNGQALPTNDYATSALWPTMFGYPEDVNEPYSFPMYSYPMVFKASEKGIEALNPPTHIAPQNSGIFFVARRYEPAYAMMAINGTNMNPLNAKVAKATDWTYDIVMEDGGRSMRMTMVQGSPFTFFQFNNTNAEFNWIRGGTVEVLAGNENSNALLIRAEEPKDRNFQYFGLYAPEGTTWNISPGINDIRIKKIEAVLPAGRNYVTMALLPDDTVNTFNEYKKYAYNIITDTKVEWSYNPSTSKVTTKFLVDTMDKPESQAEGTLFGLLPHQWRNTKATLLNKYTYDTIRGKMKVCAGTEFSTELTYQGVLPGLPEVNDSEKTKLQAYLDEFAEKSKNITDDATDLVKRDYITYHETHELAQGYDNSTYWTGKSIGKAAQLIQIAEQLGDTEKAEAIVESLKAELEQWFSPPEVVDTTSQEDYFFYYNQDVGTMIGYPAGHASDTQLNDHHFHYGYFIHAAAQVAIRDPEWAKQENWGGMVTELIKDIAYWERNQKEYPFLRHFNPYRGHSFAAGHQQFFDGNNQESSSEAMNAWASIILWGEATGNTEIRDLGIYLYATEEESIHNYWFDIHEDILMPQFIYNDPGATERTPGRKMEKFYSSLVWGGKLDYGTWWTAEPIEIHGINVLPVTGASLYLGRKSDYVTRFYNNCYERQARFVPPADNPGAKLDTRWQDIMTQYLALSDPSRALGIWRDDLPEEAEGVEYGETKAHTFHWMKSLERYGQPDYTVTGDYPLSYVFNKNGQKSYVAFNLTGSEIQVRFTDGKVITVPPYIGREKPEPVTNLEITEVSHCEMSAGWTPSVSPDVFSYKVVVTDLTENNVIAEAVTNNNSYSIHTNVKSSHSFEIVVFALNEKNVASDKAVCSTTTFAVPPATGLHVVDLSNDLISVAWSASACENVGRYNVQIVESAAPSVPQKISTTNLSRLFDGLLENTTYDITVWAVNQYGQESAPVSITETTREINRPAPPSSLRITYTGGYSLGLAWNVSVTENVTYTVHSVYLKSGTGIELYSSVIAEGITDTEYLVTDLDSGVEYEFFVTAVNQEGVHSLESNHTRGETLDVEPPTVPKNVYCISKTRKSITIGWTSSTDNKEVAGYVLSVDDLIDGSLIPANSTQYTITGLNPGQLYSISVKAVDTSGNSSLFSNPPCSVETDYYPDSPTGLKASNIKTNSLSLSWTASTCEDVTAYVVYQNINGVFEDISGQISTTSFNVSGLKASTKYTFRVESVTGDDVHSEPSATASATTLNDGWVFEGDLPNGLKLHYKATAAYAGGKVVITFESDPGVEWVYLYAPGHTSMVKESDTLWKAELSGYNDGQTVEFYFCARKNGQEGNNVTEKHKYTINSVPDIEKPTTPTALEQVSVSPTSAVLKWNASSDNVKVTKYVIKGGPEDIEVSASSSSQVSGTVTGLTPDSSYTFVVTALDAAGNESDESNSVNVFTPDGPDLFEFSGEHAVFGSYYGTIRYEGGAVIVTCKTDPNANAILIFPSTGGGHFMKDSGDGTFTWETTALSAGDTFIIHNLVFQNPIQWESHKTIQWTVQ